MNESYYPSNGTEGVGFISKWCENCKRDPASFGGMVSCRLRAASISNYTNLQAGGNA